MATLNRTIVLATFIKHETLTLDYLDQMANPGIISKENHLQYLLEELIESGHIHMLHGVIPYTYTITTKGIIEGARLVRESLRLPQLPSGQK